MKPTHVLIIDDDAKRAQAILAGEGGLSIKHLWFNPRRFPPGKVYNESNEVFQTGDFEAAKRFISTIQGDTLILMDCRLPTTAHPELNNIVRNFVECEGSRATVLALAYSGGGAVTAEDLAIRLGNHAIAYTRSINGSEDMLGVLQAGLERWQEAKKNEDPLKRLWPSGSENFFAAGAVVPHDWEEDWKVGLTTNEILARLESTHGDGQSRYLREIDKYLRELFGREIPRHWYASDVFHKVLKHLVGQSAAAHHWHLKVRQGGPEKDDYRKTTGRCLDLGSLVILLAVASRGRSDWVSNFPKWATSDEIAEQTDSQAWELTNALAGKEGLFQRISYNRFSKGAGIRHVELSENALHIYLTISLEESAFDEQPWLSVLQGDGRAGNSTQALSNAIDAISRSKRGIDQKCWIKLGPCSERGAKSKLSFTLGPPPATRKGAGA